MLSKSKLDNIDKWKKNNKLNRKLINNILKKEILLMNKLDL